MRSWRRSGKGCLAFWLAWVNPLLTKPRKRCVREQMDNCRGGCVAPQWLNKAAKVAAATEDAENLDMFALDAVDDDVVAHWEAPQAWAQIFVAGAAYIGMACEEKESVDYRINEPVGDFDAIALGAM